MEETLHEPDQVGSLLAGDESERIAAYTAIESVIRAQASSRPGDEQGLQSAQSLFAVECAAPLIQSVLCAPASRVAEKEWRRAALLLFHMTQVDSVSVGIAMFIRPAKVLDCERSSVGQLVLNTPDSVLGLLLAKAPADWGRNDAITLAIGLAYWLPWHSDGLAGLLPAAARTDENLDTALTAPEVFAYCIGQSPFFAPGRRDPDRLKPLAILVLELARDPPEEIVSADAVACLWLSLAWLCGHNNPGCAKAVWEAGFLDVLLPVMDSFSPIERISKCYICTELFHSLKELVHNTTLAGVDVHPQLEEMNLIDIIIGNLTAYQMIGKPESANKISVLYGGLMLLDQNLSAPQCKRIRDKVRSAGSGMFRYILDNPVIIAADLGFESSVVAVKIAAIIWGKDEDGGLSFSTNEIRMLIRMLDHRYISKHSLSHLYPMSLDYAQPLLHMTISDANKDLLLAVGEELLPVVIDALLLDPDHPRTRDITTDFEAVKGPVQADFTEVLCQLAMYPAGAHALLQWGGAQTSTSSAVVVALEAVAEVGWTAEAKVAAKRGLIALEEHVDQEHDEPVMGANARGDEHVMLSYNWSYQPTMKRLNSALKAREYNVWIDIEKMQGSTVEAMSAAVEDCAVMCYGICEAYKESANCRLEAQYAYQRQKEMVPLMLEEEYRANGWLGMLLGVRLWYGFYGLVLESDKAFESKVTELCRELGERGKLLPAQASTGREGTLAVAGTATAGGAKEVVTISESVPPTNIGAANSASSAPPTTTPLPVQMSTISSGTLSVGRGSPAGGCSPSLRVSTVSPATDRTPQRDQRIGVIGVATGQQGQHQEHDELVSYGENAGIIALLQQQREHDAAMRRECDEKLREALSAQLDAEVMHVALKQRELAALHSRFEGLHNVGLLTDAERDRLDDLIADDGDGDQGHGSRLYAGQEQRQHPITAVDQTVVGRMIALSGKMPGPAAFARQLKRKFLS